MTEQIEKTNNDNLQTETMSLSDTSKKIRFLMSKGKTVSEIYHLLKEYGVTTKSGGEIRYQHVRNVSITPIKS